MRSLKSLALITLLFASTACVGSKEADAPTPSEPAPPPEAQAPGWDQAGGDARRSRSTQDGGPVGVPTFMWSALIEEDLATEPVLGSVGSRRLVLVAGLKTLWAVDFEDGQEAWSVELPGPVSAAPTVVGDRVWVGSMDGFGLVLDLETGSEIGIYEADFPIDAPGLTVDGLVAMEETARAGNVPTSRLHLIDPNSLEARWHFDFVGGEGCSPASDGERVFVHAAGGVTAVKLADGSLIWKHERELRRQPIGPVVAGGRVLVQSVKRLPLGQLTALDAETGRVLWEESLRSRAIAAPAMTEEALFLVLSAGRLQRRDPASGALAWETDLPARSETAPVVTLDRVFVGGVGYVAAFDRASGAPVWTLDIDGEAAQMLVEGDAILMTTLSGFLHRLVSSE